LTETDDKLLDLLRRGDDGAFERLFLRYYMQVYRVLYGFTGRREEAEDLAQETFLELYRHAPRIEQGATLAAWLCRVALNKSRNVQRGERRERERMEQALRLAPPDEHDPHDGLLRDEEQARVREALARLPERQSRLLVLRHAGLSYAEVAAVLEVAPGSVGTLLARAERAFMAAYRGEGTAPVEGLAVERTLP
jgi:RNA polymerase sigma-70 factor (ECF subfamily)